MTADPATPADPRDRLADAIPKLRAFAISLTRDVTRADDLVQDAIVKAWSNMDKFDPATNLDAWLFTILRNTFYSALRKSRREVPDPDGAYSAMIAVSPAHESRLAFKDFQRAFDQLSPEHREVLILVGASGFSCDEAAEMMGVAAGTVKSRASRARRRLAELLHLEDGEDLFTGTDRATRAVVLRSAVAAG
jgi:RNA polymerase sigma-70 factor (ECF subfamily)